MNTVTLLFQATLLTIKISIAAIVIGLLFGTLIGIFNSKKLTIPFVSRCLGLYINIIRGTPLFIQLLLVYFALPEILGCNMSPVAAGITTLGINSTAYIAEIIRSGINSIPDGQWEACHVLGYSTTKALRFIILPQAIKNVLPAITNELIALIKESSILMILGVPELTKVSKDIVARELNPAEIYLTTGLIYFTMTSLLSLAAKKLEGKYHEHH